MLGLRCLHIDVMLRHTLLWNRFYRKIWSTWGEKLSKCLPQHPFTSKKHSRNKLIKNNSIFQSTQSAVKKTYRKAKVCNNQINCILVIYKEKLCIIQIICCFLWKNKLIQTQKPWEKWLKYLPWKCRVYGMLLEGGSWFKL